VDVVRYIRRRYSATQLGTNPAVGTHCVRFFSSYSLAVIFNFFKTKCTIDLIFMDLQHNRAVQGEEREANSTALLKRDSSELRRKQGWLSIVFFGWWLEILATILVLGMFAALVATLRMYDRRALEEWPLAISINALISVESVIMKSAMILVIAQGMLMPGIVVSVAL
jgi:hypothetical protein